MKYGNVTLFVDYAGEGWQLSGLAYFTEDEDSDFDDEFDVSQEFNTKKAAVAKAKWLANNLVGDEANTVTVLVAGSEALYCSNNKCPVRKVRKTRKTRR